MSQKLADLEYEFRSHHHALIDLINDEGSLAREQDVLDTHDDLIAELTVCVKQVIGTFSPVATGFSHKIASQKLAHMQKSLASISSSSSSSSLTVICIVLQYR